MLNSSFAFAVGILASALLPTAARAEPGAAWALQMRTIHRAYLELLPHAASAPDFYDPKRKEKNEGLTRRVADAASGLRKLTPAKDHDPGTGLLVGMFADHLERAAQEVHRGNLGVARQLLNSTPAYCVACHTRSDQGPDFSRIGVETPKPIPGMTSVENARFLVATRQYQAALQSYETILHSIPSDPESAAQWRHAIYGALAVSVRVLHDPVRTIAILDEVLSRGFISDGLREDVSAWRKQAEEWRLAPGASAISLSQLRALYEKARAIQVAPMDRAADLTYLRMSAAAHELLRGTATGESGSEALFLLGISYEVLRDWDLWTLHEALYERCIRQAPHTPIAQKCLKRFQDSIAMDYVGLATPPDAEQQLRELEGLARLPAP